MQQLISVLLIIILLVGGSFVTSAQNEEEYNSDEISNDGKGWVFGLNMGIYYVSKNTAANYNGSLYNENNVGYVLSNYYWYQDIFHALGATDSIAVAGLPQNMHYKMSVQPGIYTQYCFNPTMALIIQFNYMKLKAEDVIIFEVDPKTYLTEPDLRLYPIHGVEERIYADIGYKRTYPKSQKFSYYYMGGLNVNSTQVKKSSFWVEDIEYTMIDNIDGSYSPNGNYQTVNIYQGGIGVGIFAGAGTTFTFPNGYVAELGLTTHWLMVNLTGYQSMNPGVGMNVRFMF
jgi:hypothetical protein